MKQSHPAGIGLWSVSIRGIGWPVFVPGHTARAAWEAAGPRLGWPSYGDVDCVLVSDRHEDQPAPAPPVKARGRARRVEARV